MGFALWAALTLWTHLAGYALAARLAPRSSTLERATLALFAGEGLMLAQVVALGHLSIFTRPALSVTAVLVGAVTLALGLATGDRAATRAAVAQDMGAPKRLLSEGALVAHLLVFAPTLWMLAICAKIAWFYRSWTWDPSWYHVPITNYAIQNGSLAWFDSGNIYTAGYPRTVELLAAWHCVLPMNHRLDDASQLPFVVIGALVVAAWARREGASRSVSAAAGAAWVALPPVFLQSYATFVDIAFGASIAAGWYFATGPNTRLARWASSMGFLFAVSCKFTGCFHLAMAFPLIAGRFVAEIYASRGRRLRTFFDAFFMLAVLAPVFVEKYVQNAVLKKNLFWPYITRLPVVGLMPGAEAPEPVMGAPIGSRLYFWGGPEYWEKMFQSWATLSPGWHPTPLSGGYGAVFLFLFVPATVAVAWDVLRRKAPARWLALPALFVIAHTVPMPFWTRYTLAGAAAGAVAWALLVSQLSRVRSVLAGLVLAALTTAMALDARAGFVVYPRHWEEVWRSNWQTRSVLQVDTFLWPTAWGAAKEREFRAGDVLVYDDGVQFLSDLFTYDYRSRVVYVRQGDDAAGFVRRVRELNARWVIVQGGSPADHLLRRAGGEYLFTVPNGTAVALRLRRD